MSSPSPSQVSKGLIRGAVVALLAVTAIAAAAWLLIGNPALKIGPGYLGLAGFGIVVAVLILHGIHETRRIRRVVTEALQGRPSLTDHEFGRRFYEPPIAPVASRLRRLLAEHLECDLGGMLPEDDFESWLQLSSGPDSASDTFFEELAIVFQLRRDSPWPERFGSFDALVRFVAANTPARPGVAGTPAPGVGRGASPDIATTPPGMRCQP